MRASFFGNIEAVEILLSTKSNISLPYYFCEIYVNYANHVCVINDWNE